MLLAGKECREGVAHQNALLPEDKKIRKQERNKGEREKVEEGEVTLH